MSTTGAAVGTHVGVLGRIDNLPTPRRGWGKGAGGCLFKFRQASISPALGARLAPFLSDSAVAAIDNHVVTPGREGVLWLQGSVLQQLLTKLVSLQEQHAAQQTPNAALCEVCCGACATVCGTCAAGDVASRRQLNEKDAEIASLRAMLAEYEKTNTSGSGRKQKLRVDYNADPIRGDKRTVMGHWEWTISKGLKN